MTTPLIQRMQVQLPDFRNLGAILRTICAANLLALLVALSGSNSLHELEIRFLDAAALLEAVLLISLGLIALLRDVLARLPYREGAWVSWALVCAVTVSVRRGYSGFLTSTPMDYWRDLAWASTFTYGLLAYFRLRGRAMSPLLTEARLQALQARIRPHFLFNSLNAVLSLIRSQPAKAERALEDLADLFRVFMAENRELALLSREVELASQYLNIEELRLGERLKVEWHTDRMPHDALIPPLTMQPLLENAVYHGIEPSAMPGVITINVFRARDEVHIDIRNPYFKDGGQHHAGNKMAMANIRERLALHFDAEASLNTTVGSDYYQVHLTIPYVVRKPGQ
ncbi:MAG: histidine kinase [Burkholderiales bacterium]|nr:histidine kinase [Burkholderiales bacterium]